MYDQEKYEPLEASAFFADGLSFRSQVDGTVARGQLMLDEHFYQGKVQGQLAENFPDRVTVDRQLLERGQERFNIFCAPCHGQTGAGNGMIVQRGLKQPPTFHQQRLREMPVGHFYDVVTNGFGVMYSYSSRISVADRWAIVAYIKGVTTKPEPRIRPTAGRGPKATSMNESITQQSAALHPYLDNLQRRALVVGLIGLAATAVGYFTDVEQFFRSYLLAFTFWIGLPLGSLGILMIHHVGGGTWGFSIRRLLEAGTRTLPLLFVLSLPILFLGLHDLYEWTHQNVVQKDSILQQKIPFLNEPFFIARTVLYFAIWGLFAFLLNRWSLQQDQTTETHPTHRMQILSGPGIVIFFLTATLASIDWLMSLEPHWFSTILRHHLHHRHGANDLGVHVPHRRPPLASGAAPRRDYRAAPPRLGHLYASLRYALGLYLVFPVDHHLVG